MNDDAPLPAGTFATWLADMHAALRGERDAVVPCDGCTACCTASQFVHIGPEEHDALSHIPSQVLFPAPGLAKGYVVLGYDERGHCPMLVDGKCSIYDHRPRACRTYDCRIFAATGIDVDEDDATKVDVGRRARRWQFDFSTDEDRSLQEAVLAAVRFAQQRRVQATERAVLAIRRVEGRRSAGA